MIYLIDFIIVLYSYLITHEQTPASPPISLLKPPARACRRSDQHPFRVLAFNQHPQNLVIRIVLTLQESYIYQALTWAYK